MHPENALHPWWYGTGFLVNGHGDPIAFGKVVNVDDVTYEKENKIMEKVTRNDRINGRTIKHCVKDGMQVVMRDGRVYVVETLSCGELYLMNHNGHYDMNIFKDDMSCCFNERNDIVAIYSRTRNFHDNYSCFLARGIDRDLIWEREEEVIPMTQEEIEKKLGYKIRIKEE